MSQAVNSYVLGITRKGATGTQCLTAARVRSALPLSQLRWGEGSGAQKPEPAVAAETPEEARETAYQEARATLAKEMLTRLAQQDPAVFEQVVLDVLLAIGYGGSRPGCRSTPWAQRGRWPGRGDL